MEYYSIKKKEWNFAICNNMDGPGMYYTQWKSQRMTSTVCYHLYVKSKKSEINDYYKTKTDSRIWEQTSSYWWC